MSVIDSAVLERHGLKPEEYDRILELMGRTPRQVESALIDVFSARASAVITNVPGPRETVYLAGAPLRAVAVWAPTSGSVAMSVSILSYDGRITVGVMTDAGLVPDPATIVDGFQAELEAIARIRRPRSHTRAEPAARRRATR